MGIIGIPLVLGTGWILVYIFQNIIIPILENMGL